MDLRLPPHEDSGRKAGGAARLTPVDVRFAGVLPRQTVGTLVWRQGDELILMATCSDQADGPVLAHPTARVWT